MQIGIVYQDGFVANVYDSGDYAADICKRMQKKFPWYKWSYSYHTVLITPKEPQTVVTGGHELFD